MRDHQVGSIRRDALTHADALYRLARHLTGNDAEAEDLVQDTYARAFAAEAEWDPGSSLRAWLFRILRNAHIDSWRRKRRSPLTGACDTDSFSDDLGIDEGIRGDQELARLRQVVASEIEAALAALSLDERTVIALDHEGLTEGEVARVLGCAVGTVKSRLSRARAQLRRRLRDYSR